MNVKQFTVLKTRLETGEILVAEIDVPGKVNKLTEALWDELSELFSLCDARENLRGLVLASAKPGVFLAGAALEEFVGVSEETLQLMLARAHRVFHQAESLRVPVVTAVSGAALGGGFELLLSAHGVVAADDERLQLGLPETKLGLMPGAGGTQRLPRMTGADFAAKLICSGASITPREALERKIVDRVCPREEVLAEAVALADMLAGAGFRPKRLHDNSQLYREEPEEQLVARLQAEAVGGKDSPALRAACEAVGRGMFLPFHEGLALEARLFTSLMMTEATQNAIRAFLAR